MIKFKSYNDHRIAMSCIVLGLSSGRSFSVDNIKCIDKSFPGFIGTLLELLRVEK